MSHGKTPRDPFSAICLLIIVVQDIFRFCIFHLVNQMNPPLGACVGCGRVCVVCGFKAIGV